MLVEPSSTKIRILNLTLFRKNRRNQEKYSFQMDYYASLLTCKDKKMHQYRKIQKNTE